MYPITENHELIAFAINNDGKFQISTGLVQDINNTVDTNTPFALIYDKKGCYLYSADRFALLKETSLKDTSRSVLDVNNVTVDTNNLELSALIDSRSLGYTNLFQAKASCEECPVDFVSQNPPSNICWAAVIASIANYCNGTSLTAVSVAQAFYGASNYDRGINDSVAPSIFDDYDLSYTYKNQKPSDNVMLGNIQDDYPIYGSFTWSGGRHGGVIYGINVIGGYIYIMDPESGFTSASASSSGYKYVSDYSNVTLTLDRAVCHSW